MQRYFKEITGDELLISGDDLHHIKNVMRMKPGHKVSVCDKGQCFICQLDHYLDKEVVFKVVEKIEHSNELEVEIHLAVGLLKGDKFDLVMQKATEIGVTKIIPLEMKRSIVKLDSKKEAKKKARWQKIVKEAAEQSKRNIIPEVESIQTLDDLIKRESNIKLFAYEQTDKSITLFSHLQKCVKSDIILIVVGPEGGFDIKEVEKLNTNEFIEVSLGKRILRAETASIYFVSVISSFLENMGC
jgi:16S rRNA (uracil1498-N3)-methyltransferase